MENKAITEEILKQIVYLKDVKQMSFPAIINELSLDCAYSTVRNAYMKSTEKPDIPRNAHRRFDEEETSKIVYCRDVLKMDWPSISERFNRSYSTVSSAYYKAKKGTLKPKVSKMSLASAET